MGRKFAARVVYARTFNTQNVAGQLLNKLFLDELATQGHVYILTERKRVLRTSVPKLHLIELPDSGFSLVGSWASDARTAVRHG